jgi:hypothetical protein
MESVSSCELRQGTHAAANVELAAAAAAVGRQVCTAEPFFDPDGASATL